MDLGLVKINATSTKASTPQSCRRCRHPLTSRVVERRRPGLWSSTRKRSVQKIAARENETGRQTIERRLRESQRVEERVVDIYDMDDFIREVKHDAKDSLVVLEIDSQQVCQSGLYEEAELHWQEDQKMKEEELWGICKNIKHSFQRIARECPDVKFLALNADTESGSVVCDELQVDIIPTIQFYRDGQLLWQHKGALDWQQDLGEGVLYYGDTFAGGKKASDHVEELRCEEDLQAFVNSHDENSLVVVDMCLNSAEPCVKVFPAVLALARSFEGYAAFGRFMGDSGPESEAVFQKHSIQQVPSFLFYRSGKEVGRVVSSSRADLIGHILQLQNDMGIPPPPSVGKGKRRRQRTPS